MGVSHRRNLAAAAERMKQTREAGTGVGTPAPAAPIPPREPLAQVSFASPKAKERAVELGMDWLQFARSNRTPSSMSGWTKRDVDQVHREGGDGSA